MDCAKGRVRGEGGALSLLEKIMWFVLWLIVFLFIYGNYRVTSVNSACQALGWEGGEAFINKPDTCYVKTRVPLSAAQKRP